LNTVSVSDVWTWVGKLFHTAEPATEEECFPTCVCETSRCWRQQKGL